MKVFDKKRQEILMKSHSIFSQNGIRNVSMDDLCRMMGISKKTLYKYVSNKNDLLKKTLEQLHTHVVDKIEEIKGKNLNAIDCLLETSKAASENQMHTNPVIIFELKKYYPEVYNEYISRKKDTIVGILQENIEMGIKQGLYRHDLNKEIVAHLYFKKIQDFLSNENDDTRNFSCATIFETMFENHIRGISNKTGIEYFEKQKAKLNYHI
jgi:AcrR family transcriptional regulator